MLLAMRHAAVNMVYVETLMIIANVANVSISVVSCSFILGLDLNYN